MTYQVVKTSPQRKITHATALEVNEDNKRLCQTYCGAPLFGDSLLALQEPITCRKCIKYLARRQQ